MSPIAGGGGSYGCRVAIGILGGESSSFVFLLLAMSTATSRKVILASDRVTPHLFMLTSALLINKCLTGVSGANQLYTGLRDHLKQINLEPEHQLSNRLASHHKCLLISRRVNFMKLGKDNRRRRRIGIGSARP